MSSGRGLLSGEREEEERKAKWFFLRGFFSFVFPLLLFVSVTYVLRSGYRCGYVNTVKGMH